MKRCALENVPEEIKKLTRKLVGKDFRGLIVFTVWLRIQRAVLLTSFSHLLPVKLNCIFAHFLFFKSLILQ